MGDTQLYSAHDIEKLKQKIATYRETLTTLKTGNSTEDYHLMKDEFHGFKAKITDLEELMELMDEEKSMQIAGYKQEIKKFSVQIDALNQTIEDLNRKISSIMSNMNGGNSDNLIEVKNPSIASQGSQNTGGNASINETPQTNEQSSIPLSNHPPSYNQLQKIVSQSKSIEELPTDLTPMERIAIQNNVSEGQKYVTKRNTPVNSMNPSHFYTGQHKNNTPRSAGHRNNPVPIKGITIKCIESKALPSSESTPVNNEAAKEILKQAHEVAPIENTEEPIQKVEESIQKTEEPIEPSNDTKQQEEKNNESISFFKLFWKKLI